MKLLNLTGRYFLILILFLLLAWCGLFYYYIQSVIYEEVDEYLTFREDEIISEIQDNPALLYESSIHFSDFKVKRISFTDYQKFLLKHKNGEFKDIRKFIEFEGEEESFRLKRSVFQLNNSYYELTSITTLMKSDDILYTLVITISVFSVLLFILVFVLNKLILHRLWKPFYETIAKIKQYKLDKETEVFFNSSRISEFQELNDSIKELIHNNLNVYRNQKHFIENASHEMQTPVGIIQTKIELLMEDPSINKEQALLMGDVNEQIDRLSSLNKALLLLSKIESNQFSENRKVNINAVILKCCEYFNDLLEFKNISLKILDQDEVSFFMNEDLAEILFTNLIKNAINHNSIAGHIHIHIKENEFLISNTGQTLGFDPKLLFERFNKKSDNPQSNGLGLAIVKKICTLYSFDITYSYAFQSHTFKVVF